RQMERGAVPRPNRCLKYFVGTSGTKGSKIRRWRGQDSNRRFRGGSARRFVCPLSSLLASAPPAKAKGADPSRASRGATYRATSRHGGATSSWNAERDQIGMPSEIIADSQATSPGIRRHAVLALDVPPEAQESGGAELQAARHDATKLTKALPERAPPTSKGCRRLA